MRTIMMTEVDSRKMIQTLLKTNFLEFRVNQTPFFSPDVAIVAIYVMTSLAAVIEALETEFTATLKVVYESWCQFVCSIGFRDPNKEKLVTLLKSRTGLIRVHRRLIATTVVSKVSGV